jgi:signal transduction histidine kinase/ActR/RegA family two-component response regulator
MPRQRGGLGVDRVLDDGVMSDVGAPEGSSLGGEPTAARVRTVLVADDQAPLRALVWATLSSRYRVLEATDGAEALALVRADRPDVVLLDVTMPRADGFAVCRQIKNDPELKKTIVLILTGRATEADQRAGTSAGADGYLTKPFSPSALLLVIERHLSVDGSAGPTTPPTVERPRISADSSHDLAQLLLYARELSALHEAARHQASQFRRLVEIGQELVGVSDLDWLVRHALERATAFSGCAGGRVLLAVGDDRHLAIRAAIGPTWSDAVDELQVGMLAQRALIERRPIVVLEDGEVQVGGLTSESRRGAVALFLPLAAPAGQVIGVLSLFDCARLGQLDDHDFDAFQLLAAQAGAAVETARLYHELADRELRLQDLVRRLLVAQEEERKVVAYEVHDGLAQVAAASLQHLQAFAAHYSSRNPQRRQQLDRSLELARQTVREARLVIGNLRSTVLDDLGLATAVRTEIEERRAEGWEITFDEALGPTRLPPTIEMAVLRVIQESFSNVRKHAKSTRARVELVRRDRVLSLEIQDWGVGFDPENLAASAGRGERVGLTSMRERVGLLGGTFNLSSRPGEGTRLVIEIPVGG